MSLYADQAFLQQHIQSRAAQLSSLPTVSLLAGKSGLVLVYAYLYQEFEEENYFSAYADLLDECVHLLQENPMSATLSSGFGGVLWVIRHLMNQQLLDAENESVLTEMEDSLIQSFSVDAKTKNYDLFHGLIGKGLYFLESPHKPSSREALRQIVQLLSQWAVETPQGIAWIDYDFGQVYDPQGTVYNLGMAHGIPSIISFLARVYTLKIEPTLVEKLLTKAVQWLLTQTVVVGMSQFSGIANTGRESRLAWCYGDLGPALALLYAAQALNQLHWREKAIEIALYTTQRNIAHASIHQEHTLWDTGFCHGTSGLSHIYYRLYQHTKIPAFLRASDYWLQQTLVYPTPTVFPYVDETANHLQWSSDASLLTGLAGTIQVLLTRLNPIYTDWDAIFMTNRLPDT